MNSAACPDCARPLPSGIPGGLCPACLLGLKGQVTDLLTAEESTLEASPGSEEIPSGTIGHYRLLEVIGEGGFGAVWMAEQLEPVRRKVALKIIKPGMDSRQVIARFEAERQALALMDHPNIARVFDGGTTVSGRPYFVMELVRGLPITEFCDARQMTTRERLELFISVCQAVQHAHQKGVIHRDLKPSNILVTEQDGRPVPKVIDFGVAKAVAEPLTDKTLFTRFHQFLGTPAYMSPEQAGLGGMDVDTRTDVYSLGVLLYELLTGRPPLDPKQLRESGLEAMLRSIQEAEAPRPSTRLSTLKRDDLTAVAARRSEDPQRLSRLVRGDLDWIVLKALEKDRTRRYETANALAADVRRYLDNEPISARPPSSGYRIQKAWRRNRLAFSAGLAVATALLVGVAVSTWMYVREAASYREARAAETEQRRLLGVATATSRSLRAALYASEMNVAYHAWEAGAEVYARTLLGRQRPSSGSLEPDLRGFEWRYLWSMTRSQERFTLTNVANWGLAVSQDGRWMAGGINGGSSTNRDARVRLWNLSERREVAALRTNSTWMYSLAFSPDSMRLAAAVETDQVAVWDLESRSVSKIFHVPWKEGLLGIVFSPDSRSGVATGGYMYSDVKPGHVGLWNGDTGELLWSQSFPRWVQQAVFSPDGRTLAVACGDGVVRVLDAKDGAVRLELPKATGFVLAVAFTADGTSLAAADEKGYVRIWDGTSGRPELTFKAHDFPIYAVQFTRDGRQLVTASRDFTARIWDRQGGVELARFAGHQGGVTTVHLARNDETLITSSQDGHVKVWDLHGSRLSSQKITLPNGGRSVPRFVAGGAVLAAFDGMSGSIEFYRPATAERFGNMPGFEVAATRDGRGLAVLQTNRVVFLNPSTLEGTGDVRISEVSHARPAFSPDGRLLAFRRRGTNPVAGGDRVTLVDTGRLLVTHEIETGDEGTGPVFFALGGKLLLAIQAEIQQVSVWETSTWRRVARLQGPLAEAWVVDVSPDGRLMALSGYNGWIRLWDLDRMELLDSIDAGLGRIDSIAFDAEGRTLGVGTIQGAVKLFSLAARQEMASLRGHRSLVDHVTFSPDGQYLASSSLDQTVRIWRAPSWNEIHAAEPIEATPSSIPQGNRTP